MEIEFIYALKALILPPGGFFLLMTVAVILCIRHKVLGISLMIASLLGFYILCLPIVSNQLALTLETYEPININCIHFKDQQAIVVLGGGMHQNSPEYGLPAMISDRTLARLRYAAKLAQISSLPIMVVGGKVFDQHLASEAELMTDILQNEFNRPVQWQERNSRNTAQNAQFSWELLAKQRVGHIVLVTHARHMPRAVEQFQRVGFKVTPAPISFLSGAKTIRFMDFLPSASILSLNTALLHEVIGKWWYQLRYN